MPRDVPGAFPAPSLNVITEGLISACSHRSSKFLVSHQSLDSSAGRAKFSLKNTVRDLPSPDFPALQSHVGTFPSLHAAQTPVQGSGDKSSRDLQSLGSRSRPHLGSCRLHPDAEPRTSCGMGTFNGMLKRKPHPYLPAAVIPSPAAHSRFPGSCREGSARRSLSHSRCIPAGGTSLINPACPGSRQEAPGASSSPSLHRRGGDVSGTLIRASPSSLSACAGRDEAAAAAGSRGGS